jgi:acetyltransferase-like isoleucine patch superfamily enzyme
VTFLEASRVSNIRGQREAISIGTQSVIGGELLTFRHGGSIRLGSWCFVGEGSRIWSAEKIEIGDRVLISHGVNIHDCDAHPKDLKARHEQFRNIVTTGHPPEISSIAAAPVVIEDDAWIGFNATVLKGVRIGRGSIVAACSVVTRDVPPNSLFIGDSVVGVVDDRA